MTPRRSSAPCISEGYRQVPTVEEAGLVLYNTCSIRDKAEQKVFNRLNDYKKLQKQGKSSACSAAWRSRKVKRSSNGRLTSRWSADRPPTATFPQMLVQLEAGNQRVTGLDDRQTDETLRDRVHLSQQSPSRLHHHH